MHFPSMSRNGKVATAVGMDKLSSSECLAMVFSVKKFDHYLFWNLVAFFIDHMAIKFMVN